MSNITDEAMAAVSALVNVPLDTTPPATSDAGEWLDAPTHDGWWWMACDDRILGCYDMVAALPLKPDHWNIPAEKKPKVTYADARPPAPPKPALPRERQVTLTAKVFRYKKCGDDCWHVEETINGRKQPVPDERGVTMIHAVQWVRDNYGLEPVVTDGEQR